MAFGTVLDGVPRYFALGLFEEPKWLFSYPVCGLFPPVSACEGIKLVPYVVC